MGKGDSICHGCKKKSSCRDYSENEQLNKEGLSLSIVECENFAN